MSNLPPTSDRFVEFIEEDDGTTTAIVERPDGTRYELHGVKLTGYDPGTPGGEGVTTVPVNFVVTERK